MSWVRSFLLLVAASILTDIVAWNQTTVAFIRDDTPLWVMLRIGVTCVTLLWVCRVRRWVAPSARKKIEDATRDSVYGEVCDIASRAIRH